METIWQDVRYSVRLLARQRGFALVAILTLALGIGASTAIFSVIDAAMLHPLPYRHPEQLVRVSRRGRAADRPQRAHEPVVQRHARVAVDGRLLVDDDVGQRVPGASRRRRHARARHRRRDHHRLPHGLRRSANPRSPVQRRRYDAQRAPVLLLSNAYWRSHFGGEPGVIGREIRFDDGTATIVGVLPAGFESDMPMWRPLHIADPAQRGSGRVVSARLANGISTEEAGRRLTSVASPMLGPDGQPRKQAIRAASMLDERARGLPDDGERPGRCGRHDPAHRVRQRRGLAAGTRRDAAGRAGGARLDRRGTRPPDSAVAHREPRARRRRRTRRDRRGVALSGRARREHPGRVLARRAGRAQRPCPRRRARTDRRDRSCVRTAARAPVVPREHQRDARPRQSTSGIGAHSARRSAAHRRGNCPGRRPRRGRGVDGPQLYSRDGR